MKPKKTKPSPQLRLTRKKILILSVVILLLAGVAYFAYDHFFGDRNPLRWKIGTTYEYEFVYAGETVNSHLNPEGGTKDLSGKFDCTLRFSLTPVKKLPDGSFLSELAVVKA